MVQYKSSAQPSLSKQWVSGFPELVQEWDYDRNGVLGPADVTAGSGRRVWWVCRRGPDHHWRAKPNNRTYGAGCPFCTNRRVSVTNSLDALYPQVAAEWDPDANGRVTPSDVVATSTRVAFWRCAHHPDHAFRAVIRDRTRGLTGCPYCANERACDSNSLARVHPRLAAEWHPELNGDLTAGTVLPGSPRCVYWRCGECGHSWRARIANRALRASGCPECTRRERRSLSRREK
jgi:Probable Zinc-ribbon domain